MMYNSKFVVSIKTNGKILREFGDTVVIPFGSEYSVLLKNLNSVRAQVDVSIDGKSVLNGSKLMVPGNSSIELERFLERNDKGYRFKFIERIQNIEDNRGGIQAEDGLVRVEVWYEKQAPKVEHIYHHHHYDRWNYPYVFDRPYYGIVGSTIRNIDTEVSFTANASPTLDTKKSFLATNASAILDSYTKNDAGITSKGSISEQKFENAANFVTESESTVIVLQLKGTDTKGIPVKNAVDVKKKLSCECCGKLNIPTAKYCIDCGTNLVALT